jgi:hypothetical protein
MSVLPEAIPLRGRVRAAQLCRKAASRSLLVPQAGAQRSGARENKPTHHSHSRSKREKRFSWNAFCLRRPGKGNDRAPRAQHLRNRCLTRMCTRILKTMPAKKVARMHFQQLKFVLVCPPVEEKFVAQRSVHRSASPLQSKIGISEFNYELLAGSQHRKSMVSKMIAVSAIRRSRV